MVVPKFQFWFQNSANQNIIRFCTRFFCKLILTELTRCTLQSAARNTLEREPKSRCAELARVSSARLVSAKIMWRAWMRVPRANPELTLIRMCAASQLVRIKRMSVPPNWIYPFTLSTNKPWLGGSSLWWTGKPWIRLSSEPSLFSSARSAIHTSGLDSHSSIFLTNWQLQCTSRTHLPQRSVQSSLLQIILEIFLQFFKLFFFNKFSWNLLWCC